MSQETTGYTPERPQPSAPVEWITDQRRLKQGLDRYRKLFNDSELPLKPLVKKLYADLGSIFAHRSMGAWEASEDSSVITRSAIPGMVRESTVTRSEVAKLGKNDYVVSLLVDLSGSMKGETIQETVRGVIVLAEALDTLGIKTEILGFNNRLFGYKNFDEKMSDDVRSRIGTMEEQVSMPGSEINDDGYCVEEASLRLAQQEAAVKALFVLSDGKPVPLAIHSNSHELHKILLKLNKGEHTGNQKIIGLGLGPRTQHVEDYYALNKANISVRKMAEELGQVLRVVIDVPDELF